MRELRTYLRGRASRFSVQLPLHVRRELLAVAEEKDPSETGGILLGTWDAERCMVEAQVGPGPKAIHHSNSFIPDYAFQTKEVSRLYEESARTLSYLGDWHTHPGKPLYLSPRDTKTLKRIGTYAPARCPRPIMVVLGGESEWSAAAWVGERIGFGVIWRIGSVTLILNSRVSKQSQ